MSELRNCKKCGKMFSYSSGTLICPNCISKDEEDFKNVRQYLYENPGATLPEVSTVLEISAEKIKRFLREGRLEIVNTEGNVILECERCGKSIKSGQYCNECAKNLLRDIKNTSGQLSNSLNEKTAASRFMEMHYLNKDNKPVKNK